MTIAVVLPVLLAFASVTRAQTGSDARAERLKKIEKIVFDSDRSADVSFSPSIRLKSFDLGLSNFVFKLAPPDFSPGLPTSKACGMQHFQMKLVAEDGSMVNEFAVLLDPQTPGSPVKPNFLVARTNALSVDSDGSPRSYHPEDPIGRKFCKLTPSPNGVGFVSDRACAMDKVSDARVRVFDGTDELKKDKLEAAWKGLWPKIRDKVIPPIDPQDMPPKLAKEYYGYEDSSNDLMAFFKGDIIPETKDRLPCVRKPASRFNGYFVAGTALRHKVDVPGGDIDDADAIAEKECSPLRFLDAAVTAFFVLPGRPFGAVSKGDIVVIYAKVDGQERVVHAVIGDSGPADSFGEASVALLQLLQKGRLIPVHNIDELNSWDIDESKNLAVTVLLLGNTGITIGPRFTQAAIEAASRKALDVWNKHQSDILARLRACSQQAPLNMHH
jgi:hypothetical protein